MIDLAGRNAVVCGSTQGIGRACAIELARGGAAVTLFARRADALAEVQAELPADRGQDHQTVCVDFGSWVDVRAAANRHAESSGPVHILVNNTGGPPGGRAVDARPEEFATAFANHLLCNQVLVQALVPGMRSESYGRIINIISTSVIMPIPGLGVSNTIRGAVANWARTLATELGPDGITVNSVLPGYTATARLDSLIERKAKRAGCSTRDVEREMKSAVPAGRFGRPEEIGSVVAFLASPLASYVSGVNLPVDGGRLAAQ